MSAAKITPLVHYALTKIMTWYKIKAVTKKNCPVLQEHLCS